MKLEVLAVILIHGLVLVFNFKECINEDEVFNKYFYNPFVFLACSNGRSNLDSFPDYNSKYYSNSDSSIFISVISNNKTHSLFEIDNHKKTLMRCLSNDSINKTLLDCKVYKIIQKVYGESGEILPDNYESKKCELGNMLKEYKQNFVKVDSIYFWRNTSIILDSSLFVLPIHKELLDSNYGNIEVLVNKLRLREVDSFIDVKNFPTFFFDVWINEKGKIIAVDYNSWGKSIYADLIPAIEKHLLTRTIKSYSILHHPISVKLQIRVIIDPNFL